MNEMNVEKWWHGICGGAKREKPRETANQILFRPSRNSHGVIETRNQDPNGGRQESNRLRHETALAYCFTLI